jgi:hypothetical protein
VVDYFIPTDRQSLEDNDVDFGIAGPLLLPPQSGPVPNELIGGGKGAILYVLDRSNMGKYCASCNPPDSQVVQKVSSSALFGMFSTPDVLERLCLSVLRQRSSACVQVGQGQTIGQSGCADFCHFPLSRNPPVVSSNGPKNGIVWALLNGFGNGPPTVLYAYRATDLTELYDSSQVAGDAAGLGVKFTVPTVANDRVYVGTQTELDVYGILP